MKKYYIIIASLSVMMASSTCYAATNLLQGGLSLGANYDSNASRTPVDEIDEWETTLSGFIALTRSVPKGSLIFRYAPTIKYNERTEDTSLDHRLHFNAHRYLTELFKFNLSNLFLKTDDIWGEYLSSTATGIDDGGTDEPGDGTTDRPDPNFSDQIGRAELWANYFETSFDYEYSKDSFFTLGYSNRILEYEDNNRDNYLYNNPWVSISYAFNPQWNNNLSYNYLDASFDISEDFKTHRVNYNLNYLYSARNTYFFGLAYYQKDYDRDTAVIPFERDNYKATRGNLGWTLHYSPKTTFSITAGPSYVEDDSGEEYWTGYFDTSLHSRFKTGSWFIRADGGLDDRSFDGADQDLSEYQRVSGGVNWWMSKNWSAGLKGYVRTDDFLQNPLESNEIIYNGIASLRYSFARWYFVSARYVYNEVDADIELNSYVDHRVFITLGFSKDLNRW